MRNAPPCWRNGAETANEEFTHGASDFLRMTDAFAPPKPKELVSAKSTRAFSGLPTSLNAQSGSMAFVVVVGGSHCPCNPITQTPTSTAPAAPSRCPMLALVELTARLVEFAPAQRLMAA